MTEQAIAQYYSVISEKDRADLVGGFSGSREYGSTVSYSRLSDQAKLAVRGAYARHLKVVSDMEAVKPVSLQPSVYESVASELTAMGVTASEHNSGGNIMVVFIETVRGSWCFRDSDVAWNGSLSDPENDDVSGEIETDISTEGHSPALIARAIAVALLAWEFSESLKDYLTYNQLRETVTRNATEPAESGVCHSHDYCDANMNMLEAFADLGLPNPSEFVSTDDQYDAAISLWNDAWDIANRKQFYTAFQF